MPPPAPRLPGRQNGTRRRGARSSTAAHVALFGAGVVLFNGPLLMLWDREATVFGLPMLAVGLFGIWAALIVLLALLDERGAGGPPATASPADLATDPPPRQGGPD